MATPEPPLIQVFNRNDIGAMREIKAPEALAKASALQAKLPELDLGQMKYYSCVDGELNAIRILVDKAGNPLDPNFRMIGTILKTPANGEPCK